MKNTTLWDPQRICKLSKSNKHMYIKISMNTITISKTLLNILPNNHPTTHLISRIWVMTLSKKLLTPMSPNTDHPPNQTLTDHNLWLWLNPSSIDYLLITKLWISTSSLNNVLKKSISSHLHPYSLISSVTKRTKVVSWVETLLPSKFNYHNYTNKSKEDIATSNG